MPGGPVAKQLNRFTVLPDLYTRYQSDAAVTLNPFEWRSDLIYDAELGSGRWRVLNDLIGVMVIDSQRALQVAWKNAMTDGVSEEERKVLSSVPVSEAEALKLEQSWGDAEVRNRTMANWMDLARDKYGARDVPLYVSITNAITLFFPMGIAGCVVAYLWRLRSA